MKLMRWVGVVVAALATTTLLSLGSLTQAAQPTVTLTTEPPLAEVIPFQDPVRLILQAINGGGQPLADARLSLQLLTPPKTPWLTSDFPWVEGTTLLELGAIAPQGQVELEQVMPIRGTYTLNVQVEPLITNAFAPFSQSLSVRVPENPVKYRNVAILLAVLLVLGFAGGWVIGGRTSLEAGEIAPQRVRMLLSGAIVVAIAALLIVNFSARSASAHSEGHHTPLAIPTSRQGQQVTAQISGQTQATVGQLATQTVTLNPNIDPRPELLLNIRTLDLESHEPVFTYTGIAPADGQFTWRQQFFDGAPHQVVVEVLPPDQSNADFESFQIAQAIDVTGLEPPLSVRLITLSYFTLCFVLGLLAGLGTHRWRLQGVPHA
ncbi:hypothetical protein GS597_11675 [Synechococcales cyanobacterium C]|uniref:Uncharacterized protein n=1 Tax=Petrachloros mirabilis ULC683 TaxID=2781853 RepID=A0A8K2A060_9CYAN|nr:hypothetical protein [Petrachloros mirabilis]NCJ07151.1 hypothetical protein [Petrachloros mirabilis ULC683]